MNSMIMLWADKGPMTISVVSPFNSESITIMVGDNQLTLFRIGFQQLRDLVSAIPVAKDFRLVTKLGSEPSTKEDALNFLDDLIDNEVTAKSGRLG